MILGSCGETSETGAARAHRIITVFYAVAMAGLVGALMVEGIMLAWHAASVRVHERRALLRGER